MKDDVISRQAAIEVLSLGKEILSRVLDDIDVVGTDREKYSWGLKLIEANIEDIKELPSAQPEIIRCKDCKHRDPEDKKCDCGHDIQWQLPRQDDWYCADAKRRTE